MKKNNKGFSLVELVVVIAIMAVLVVVLAPAYLRYVDKTRLQKDVAAVGEVINAVKVAAAEEEVLEQLTHEGQAPDLWTYIKIEAGSVAQSRSAGDEVQSDKNSIVVDSLVVGKDVSAVQTAVNEIVGSTIDFKRQEVKDARLYIIFAYDDNFNIIAKVDTTCFMDCSEVKVAFDAAFDTTAEAIGANRLANLSDRMNDYSNRYNEFYDLYGSDLERYDELTELIEDKTEILNAAKNNYEEKKAELEETEANLEKLQNTITDLEAQLANWPSWLPGKTTAKKTLASTKESLAAEQVKVKNLQADLETAINDSESLEQEIKTLEAEKTSLQDTYDDEQTLVNEGKALYTEVWDEYSELGAENLTSDAFWSQFGSGSGAL